MSLSPYTLSLPVNQNTIVYGYRFSNGFHAWSFMVVTRHKTRVEVLV